MPFSSVLGASSVIKPGVCTSTTRPTVPYEGQLIYETDTDRVLAFNGSAWNPPSSVAWGKVAYASSTTDQTGISSITDVTGMSVTFTGVANRQYKVTLYLPQLYGTTAGDRARIAITDGSNNTLALAYLHITAYGSPISVSLITTANGSTTFKGRLQRDVGSGTISNYADSFSVRYLLVEDIGAV